MFSKFANLRLGNTESYLLTGGYIQYEIRANKWFLE